MEEEYDDLDDYFDDEEEDDRLELAQMALDRGESETALDLVEEYLEDHPFDVDALNICAVAATNLEDEIKALALYRKALRLDPKNGAIHHNYGVLLDRLERRAEAQVHLRKALEYQPDFPEAYVNLGNVLDELGETAEALAMYDEALKRRPDSADAYFNKGHALNRLGRYAEALDCFTEALRMEPHEPTCLNGAGYALSGLGRDEEALLYYGRAIARDRANPHYFFNRGLSYLRLGRFTEALADFDEVLALDGDFFDALVEKANVLVELGRFDEARAVLAEAERREPNSPEPPFYLALLHEREGDHEGALRALEESLARDPDSIHTLNNKGSVLMDLGRLDEAMECFEAILERTDVYPLAYYNRACIFALQGRTADAVRALSEASRFEPHFLQDAAEDPDFEGIRHRPSFQKLLRKHAAAASSS
ncbi:tetratricopeptide repeat protein [Geoalkalibacter sp.]|uniref:tetratricopeptide repeat protein n=1 Tax=Geoalkalibacter sp. TaxID=3041440 RepID=UPI00272DFF58|nr:tetratricopeptide repeat protein [Geoalkalibacter sp.]